MDWIELTLALLAFYGSHRLPAMRWTGQWLKARIGGAGYTALFSLLSILALWWVIMAAGRAPHIGLWPQAEWQRWLVNIAMPLAILLGCFGVAAPNPFAFEGRAAGFDPYRPGIAGLTRQPLLWALAIWSGAHLLVNGDLAHALVFAPFALFSLIGMPAMERRRRKGIGAGEWARLTAHTGLFPGAALITGRWRPKGLPSLPRLALALVLWVGIFHLHPVVIGAWPGV